MPSPLRLGALPLLATLLGIAGFAFASAPAYLLSIAVGLGAVVFVSYRDIREGNFSLDYIAFLALVISAATHEYLAGAVIAVMYTGGESLEAYASARAESSLSALLSRIPKTALVKRADGGTDEVLLSRVEEGARILVRGGELVPLDGTLASDAAILNLANLTGEALPESLTKGAYIKSGSVNAGEAFELSVSGTLATSTYARIVDLVKDARKDQAPFVRLADRANLPFTVATLLIAGGAYLLTGDVIRALAVLVIATPCPLIIAAPVAFVGGLSRAAGKNIIVKAPVALEAVAKTTTVFFDKTGTLTLGEPALASIELLADGLSESAALSLAASVEMHSIHPIARALVAAAKARGVTSAPATGVTEAAGTGIAGVSAGRFVSLEQAPRERSDEGGLALLMTVDGSPAAVLRLSDVLKENAVELLNGLAHSGMRIKVLTGDRRAHAEATFRGVDVELLADLEPEDKYRLVDEARAKGEVVAMVGDGLNDAPALARADVGIVFSGTENSAAVEAADAVILGHDVRQVTELFALSKRSVRIAGESVYIGIGLSVIGMLVAAAGFIVPVLGAVLQECIDVAVILNALRAAFSPRAR
ncbi:cadmium-translocating P-type ATPase [Patescibacteria group bacterium]|nr:cadmium-translocating P-type ATPase [Patescibacteria group bacterium]